MAQRRTAAGSLPKVQAGGRRYPHDHLRPYVWVLFGVLASLGDVVKALLTDPKIFNYVIMVLYALNAARWAYQKNAADCCYWLSALAITATVTFLYKH
jgi:hypothetical protein